MSQEGAPAAGETPAAGATERQCLLLACFAGSKRAAKIHRELNKRIDQGGDALLGEVVVKVDSKHKVQVHDPRRVVAGTLTPALTWGIFGLLAGGVKGLAIWAVVGAICGGLYAYYSEHLLTKDELKRIGGRLPVDSSAIVAFVRAADPRRLLSSAASSEPTTASVAEITPDLSAQVHNGATHPEEASATQDAALEMLMVRYTGEHAAKKALAESGSEKHKDKKEPEVELFVEANEHGRLRVIEPKTGTAAFSKNRDPRLGAVRRGIWLDRGLRRGQQRGPRRHRERGARRGSLGHLRRGRRCPVRHVGGAGGVRPAAEGPRRLRAARFLPGARLGGGLAQSGNDRALGRDRLAAAGPALQPGRTWGPVGGLNR